MFTVKEVKDKQIWDGFVSAQKEKTFLHAWNWGEALNAAPGYIWRFGVYEGEKLVAVFLVIKTKARRGTFIFVPQGPLLRQGYEGQALLSIIIEKLKELAKQEGCD